MPTGEVTAGQNCIGELILPVRVVKDRACCVVSREHNLFLSLSGRHGLHKACDEQAEVEQTSTEQPTALFKVSSASRYERRPNSK